MRVVSLTCSNTEIVCELGCADLLVGIDSDSDWPTEVVSSLPRVGRDLQVDAEAIAALQPDLVLASLTVPGHEKVLERLRAKGLPVWVCEPTSLQDVYQNIRDIGLRLGVTERAETLVAEMIESMTSVAPLGERPLRVIVEWWPKPVIVPGRDSWVTDMMRLACLENPLGARPVKSEPITDEQVRDINPDVIVLAWCGVPFEKYRPEVVYENAAWQDLEVVKSRRVVSIPEAFLGRPGPRLVQGIQALRELQGG